MFQFFPFEYPIVPRIGKVDGIRGHFKPLVVNCVISKGTFDKKEAEVVRAKGL